MFFGNGILCEYDPNGFYQLSCIQAHCSNVDCKTTNPFSETDLKQGDISFNQYVVDTYTYTDRVDEFEEEIAREIDELDEIENMSDEKYNIIEPGSHVALFSASNSFELFIVCKITDKSIAEDDLKDFYGHVIRKGDKFLTGVYLEKKDVSKKKAGRIYYKKHKKEVYLYPEEVFSFAVSINENDLSMSMSDYQFLSDSIN